MHRPKLVLRSPFSATPPQKPPSCAPRPSFCLHSRRAVGISCQALPCHSHRSCLCPPATVSPTAAGPCTFSSSSSNSSSSSSKSDPSHLLHHPHTARHRSTRADRQTGARSLVIIREYCPSTFVLFPPSYLLAIGTCTTCCCYRRRRRRHRRTSLKSPVALPATAQAPTPRPLAACRQSSLFCPALPCRIAKLD